jgi:hypothetical protein
MQKFSMVILVSAILAFSQTTVLPPSGTSDAFIRESLVIGDYDGDKTNDLYIKWENSSGDHSETYTIYSYEKSKYLLVVKGSVGGEKYETSGDLNDDGNVEVLIGTKIYSFESGLSKKKL